MPAGVQRLGHIVLQTPKYIEALNWYLDHLGLIVSDFCYYPGQRERGPIMSFIRCDRGSAPADHHTLAMALGPTHRYVHSAYQVADLDALAAGGEYLREQGYFRSWGIGRHIQGSQIFDYWRDPEGGFLVEHYVDGDMFDNTLEPGWAPLTASGLYQWGPPPSKDFLGVGTPMETAREVALMLDALAPRQRVRPVRPARAVQRSQFLTTQFKESKDPEMTVSILRTADAWWVQTPNGAARIRTDAPAPPSCWPTVRHRRRRALHRHRARGRPRVAVAGHDAVPAGGAGHQLRLARARRRA